LPTRAQENGVSRQTQNRLDRLARDFPELHDRIKAGELSVNAAWIAAGLGTPTFSVPEGKPELAARRIAKRYRGESLMELGQLLIDAARLEFAEVGDPLAPPPRSAEPEDLR
jgi:hypothetical protein